LVLGGTKFLGRHVALAARERGCEVTLLNRGTTNPALFADDAGVTRLTGDRTTADGLAMLAGRRWSAVIDTCGYLPAVVRASAQALREAAPVYLFVSSISVYGDFAAGPADEATPVEALHDPAVVEVGKDTYGPLKAACEAVVREAVGAVGGRAIVVRPGLIAGPDDPTDRFTYWVRRGAAGGEALAPGDGRRLVQAIDVRDLAAWMVDACLRAGGPIEGTFNATGEPTSFGELLAACRAGSTAWVWASEAFLEAQDVAPWSELPLWLPGADQRVPTARARAAGLVTRPIAETVAATRAFDAAPGRPATLAAGLSEGREQALLRAWKAQG
jgi:2'-hydroxyisoflavone reductase